MKRIFDWQVVLGIILITMSALVYLLHYLIFRDARHIFIYLIGDIAFVFLEVFLVTLVVHNLLTMRERRERLRKLNMVIGAFFSEVGTELMKSLSIFDPDSDSISRRLRISGEWTGTEFARARREILGRTVVIDHRKGDLEIVKKFLVGKRGFLLGLLENPNLLEHESFTNLLWAVFHLTEELDKRRSLKGLPEPDYRHLAGDVKRVYGLLIGEWLAYLKHLQSDYPYLFSLAVRTNPFDDEASVEVKS